MSKIVSIHSFRGGTGKSNLTANLAAQVALAGHRVAIIDTDIQSPGIHVLFGLDGNSMGHTLNEYLRAECEIDQVAYSIGEHPGAAAGRQKLAGAKLWLVPSSINGGEISRILKEGYDVARLNEGMHDLCQKLALDYLFVDTHPGLNEETLLSVLLSDVLLLVMRPDQQDIQGTAVTVDIARDLEVPNLLLVVNKVLSKYHPEQVRLEVENKYSVPVVGVLPLSEDMVDLASADLFSLYKPDHDWSRTIRQVAQHIIEA